MASLTLDRVYKSFASTPVLHGVSIDIKSGEFFSLLGPSGCGKSTLLRIIAGLEHANTGTVLVNNVRMDTIPPQKRGIGMVFQQYALWPHMTIAQNVRFGLDGLPLTQAERDERMKRALERVRMQDYSGRFPHEISGGQQQRVALARALAMQPTIILLDEPLSNLDARLRAEIRQELAELHRDLGTTMVYVTHDQDDALALSSRMAIMHQGRVQQVGTPQEIYQRPASAFVAKFIGDANLIPCEVTAPGGAGRVQVRLQSKEATVIEVPLGYDSSSVGVASRGFICVRPFHLDITSGEVGRPAGTMAGVIRSFTYRGADYGVDVEVSGGQVLHARVSDIAILGDTCQQPGGQVHLSWEAQQSVFIPMQA
jgi:ABC-type Fe3+/spermidine/putrescine transport system ATPase subunit